MNIARVADTNLEWGIVVVGRPAGLSDEFQPIISTLAGILKTRSELGLFSGSLV